MTVYCEKGHLGKQTHTRVITNAAAPVCLLWFFQTAEFTVLVHCHQTHFHPKQAADFKMKLSSSAAIDRQTTLATS